VGPSDESPGDGVGQGEESPGDGVSQGEEFPGDGVGPGVESAGDEHPVSIPTRQPPAQESAPTDQVSTQYNHLEHLNLAPCVQPAGSGSQGLPAASPGTGTKRTPRPKPNGAAPDTLPEGEAPGRRSNRTRKNTRRAIEGGSGG
jgi:hypothetical protein